MPVHEITSKPGATVSAMVGTSGKSGQRVLPVTASARNSPDFSARADRTGGGGDEVDVAGQHAGDRGRLAAIQHVQGLILRSGCRAVRPWCAGSSRRLPEPYFNSPGLFLASSISC